MQRGSGLGCCVDRRQENYTHAHALQRGEGVS